MAGSMTTDEVVEAFDCPVCNSTAGSMCKTSFGTERDRLHRERYELGVVESKPYLPNRPADDHPDYILMKERGQEERREKRRLARLSPVDNDVDVAYNQGVIGRLTRPKKAPALKYQKPICRDCNCSRVPGQRHADDCPAKPRGSGIVTRMVPRDQGDTTSLTTLTRTR